MSFLPKNSSTEPTLTVAQHRLRRDRRNRRRRAMLIGTSIVAALGALGYTAFVVWEMYFGRH